MSDLKLRDYQVEAIQAVAERLRAGIRRSLIALPTGTGKTVVFANIIDGATRKDNRCLVLAHRDELLQQAKDKLMQVSPHLEPRVGFVQGANDAYTKGIVIASIQTLARRRRILRLMDAHATALDPRYPARTEPLATAENEAAEWLRQARRDYAAARATLQTALRANEELGRTIDPDIEAGLQAAVEDARAGRDAAQRSYDEAKAARDAELFQTIAGRWPFKVIICDEAHHSEADSYREVFRMLGCYEERGPLLVGVTATPQRADGRDLGETYQEIVYHRDMLAMMRLGFLCPLRGLRVKLAEFNTSSLRVQAGDFVDADSEEALRDADAPKHVVEAWLRRAEGRKTIVFTPTIALAQEMADEFREHGVAAEAVSGVEMDERRAILARFKTGQTRVVTNAQVLTEGFDEPTVDCIVIARPTKSQPLYVQMVGRGTRISRETGKTECLVIDVVGASDRMDLTTLPKLFGLGEPETERTTESDEVTIEEARETILDQQERLIQEGRIVTKQVELFQRNDLAWQSLRPGEWILNAGEVTIAVTARPDGLWDVAAYQRGGQAERVATGLAQGYAMGAAEDYARRNPGFVSQLVDKNASWRGQPASSGQIDTLTRWRMAIPRDAQGQPTLTRGEASDMMSARIAQWRMQGARRR